MKPRKIPVAAVQLKAHDRRNFDATWPHIESLVDKAGRGGAKLIVLPECTVPAYVLGTEPLDVQCFARAADEVSNLAMRYAATIVYGAARVRDGRTYNSAIVVGPDGRELGHSAKRFLWHFDRRWFTPGETLQPIETPAGTLGVLVCADGRIPTIASTLVERGAQLLVMPTAWVTSGRDPGRFENAQADFMASVRALENRVPFIAANKTGVELESVAYCGKSVVFDAAGNTLARGGERDETIVRADVEIGTAPARPNTTFAATLTQAAPSGGRARVAFTLANAADEVARLAVLAHQADADVLLARGAPLTAGTQAAAVLASAQGEPGTLLDVAGVRIAIAGDAVFRSPHGLVEARLAGCDFFLWHAGGDAAWHVPLARTRAAELRAYVVVFAVATNRAFTVDPDGAVVAGTFDAYRMASFLYDPARAADTAVAPATDVLDGLRSVERIRRITEGAAFV